jgi:branched-chain amino acid transport system ATP-binding protein
MEPILSLKHISKTFGGFTAVADADITVTPGEARGLIGPNGAGKSTLFNVIAGAIPASSGTIRFDGSDITCWRAVKRARHGIARTFQLGGTFPKLTVVECVELALVAQARLTRRLWWRSRTTVVGTATEVLESVGLLPDRDVAVSTLSQGTQRVVELAVALASSPRLLLLDEPTAGMSTAETNDVLRLLDAVVKPRGISIVLCEHDMDVVFDVCDRVTVLNSGAVIAEGDPSSIQRNSVVADAYLGTESADA